MSFLREPDAEPIPGYRLIEPLGSGGFGEVWKCEAPGGLFKAIKFVYGNLNSLDAEGVRAEQELHALQRIKEVRHPFVLSMDRIEIVGGELVIVMELADKSLHDQYVECQNAGMIGVPRDSLLRYVRDAAEALDHMIEKHNLLHLDIKPRNLFLISDRVKVADFGLVKHLERQGGSGILGGVTPLYAPPETIQNKITPFSDQYSLAIVYQELLTGQRPFSGKNARQLAMQHLNEEPELRGLPEAERPVVARALSKEPTARFPNCLSFVRALYMARSPARPEVESATASGMRPKTMADTMDDMLMGGPPEAVQERATPLPARPYGLEDADIEVSELGITVAQPQTGTLRPTLILGLGNFGRRALMELRCRFLDRFQDLSKVPLVRFLYVDTDPEAVRSATRGAPEVALSNGAVYHLGLQPVGNYRRRMIDHLNEWLPREKLYGIPRSLQTQGSRALGRLAFADNHLRFMTRLKRDLQQATHPDTLYQSVSQTGLALRENVPRVYVIAAAGGGGSGILVDLGFELRRMLKQLKFQDADVIAFLLCGAPSDPATPKAEQANVYATLTELNHFYDAGSQFAAQYGPDAPRIVEQGQPYKCVYLMPLAHRSPESLRDAVAHLGSYIFHDVSTPVGSRLDRSRHVRRAEGVTPFRSFGTYAVWFPRGLLLRLAAREMCRRLIEEWQAAGDPTSPEAVEAAFSQAVDEPQLKPEAIAARIEESAKVPHEGTPGQALTKLLTRLEEQSQQSVAQEDPGNWAKQTLTRLQEWIGAGPGGESESGWRKSKLGRVLTQTTQQVAQEWDERLAKVAFSVMEHQGRRLASAEAVLQRFLKFCLESTHAPRQRLEQQSRRTEQSWYALGAALETCVAGGGGFSFFGGRSRKILRAFVDHATTFARQRLAEEVAAAGIQFFALLHGRLEERVREISFCRQRLRNLQEGLEAAPEEAESITAGRFAMDVTPGAATPVPSAEAYWEAIRESDTVYIVLPDGENDLERAADRFVQMLTPDQKGQLDQALQERVLTPLGGLHHICVSSGDLLRSLAGPLTDQAAESLGELLPITDVAEVESSAAAAGKSDIRSRALTHYTNAAPMVSGKDEGNQQAFLLLPASESGKSLGEQAKQAVPSLHLVRVPGQADLMFCREQGYLSAEDLQKLLGYCRAAYRDMSAIPNLSPHARFDITDWVPLDP
ncbi:MAG: protein kinase [Gemmataceae bacterium]|nr:protein kinase [Gemmataceae bacterium]